MVATTAWEHDSQASFSPADFTVQRNLKKGKPMLTSCMSKESGRGN